MLAYSPLPALRRPQGLVTFAVISYHLTQDQVVPVAAVPLIYAAAMAAEALAALGSGWLFDRTRGRVLAVLPLLVAAVPILAFASSPLIAITGVLVWGAAGGVLDSTVKALVADLVPASRTRNGVRRVRRCSGHSRHRRWSHGRCTVRAITPDTHCDRRSQPGRRSHTADRNLASASKDPSGGSLKPSLARLSILRVIGIVEVILLLGLLGERATPSCARWESADRRPVGVRKSRLNDRWQLGERPGPLLILPLLAGTAAILEIQLVEHMRDGGQD